MSWHYHAHTRTHPYGVWVYVQHCLGECYIVSHYHHSGKTDEGNCSWLHPIWPPQKRPDRDGMICMVSRTSTKWFFACTDNVYKPHLLICDCSRDISGWKLWVMKSTVLGDEANCRTAFVWDEANWVWMKPTPRQTTICVCSYNIWLYTNPKTVEWESEWESPKN